MGFSKVTNTFCPPSVLVVFGRCQDFSFLTNEKTMFSMGASDKLRSLRNQSKTHNDGAYTKVTNTERIFTFLR